MRNADRHVEHLKLDAVEQVLAVPIKDPQPTLCNGAGNSQGWI